LRIYAEFALVLIHQLRKLHPDNDFGIRYK